MAIERSPARCSPLPPLPHCALAHRHAATAVGALSGDRGGDAVVAWRDEARVEERLRELLAIGSAEILASPILARSDRDASLDRTMRLLGQVAQSVAAS